MDQNASLTQIEKLRQRLTSTSFPQDVAHRIEDEFLSLEAVVKGEGYNAEAERRLSYLNFLCDLPWDKRNEDKLDLNFAKQTLDKNHYGLESIKARILEYLSVLILNKTKGKISKQPVLAFVGLVGSGKTSLAASIAECLGKPLMRIPLGGLGSAAQLRGQSRTQSDAEPGLIMRAIVRAGVKNPVILLDELDRVTDAARADIMGVLIELLDPEQNSYFTDHYVGYPFDLSEVLFIGTANNTGNISTAVLDRLEILEMPFYSDEQKIMIAKQYLLPKAVEESGLDPSSVKVEDDVWPLIVRPLGFDGGIRTLRRNITLVTSRIAELVVEGNPGPYVITSQNIKEYIKD